MGVNKKGFHGHYIMFYLLLHFSHYHMYCTDTCQLVSIFFSKHQTHFIISETSEHGYSLREQRYQPSTIDSDDVDVDDSNDEEYVMDTEQYSTSEDASDFDRGIYIYIYM